MQLWSSLRGTLTGPRRCKRLHMGTAPAGAHAPDDNDRISPALESLPPFPAVALRALNVLAGTETSLRELCDVVRPDPVFSAEILRLANSPLVAFTKQVTNVLQASMLLGFQRLRRLVITVGLRSYLDSASAQLLHSCWRHSVACALIAEKTAKQSPVDRDLAYTGGILHDIGRVVLTSINPESYAALLARLPDGPTEMLRREREVFGIDHCQAGSRLVLAWHLPDEFSAITLHHHEPQRRDGAASELIRLSCRLADALGYASSPHGPLYGRNAVTAEYPENVRAHLPTAAELEQELRVIESA